jgi:hypothetical protein
MVKVSQSRALLRLVTEPDHETRVAPKLDVVPVNEALGLGYGLIVVATRIFVCNGTTGSGRYRTTENGYIDRVARESGVLL